MTEVDILELLRRCRDREHNPFEPEQTKLHADLEAAIAALDAARGENADERPMLRRIDPAEYADGLYRTPSGDIIRIESTETADERQAAIVAGFRRLQAAGETWVREDEACGWAADWIESGKWRRT